MVSEKIAAKKIIGTHLTIWHSAYCNGITIFYFIFFTLFTSFSDVLAAIWYDTSGQQKIDQLFC